VGIFNCLSVSLSPENAGPYVFLNRISGKCLLELSFKSIRPSFPMTDYKRPKQSMKTSEIVSRSLT